ATKSTLGDSATATSYVLLSNDFPSSGRADWPAIIGKRVGRTLLQGFPDHIADKLRVASQVRVPKAQDFDTVSSQPSISFGILEPLLRSSMQEAVQLDVQSGLQAEEVE